MYTYFWRAGYRVFPHDVTAAMLEEWNILLGIELHFYANSSFCFSMQILLLVAWAKTLYRGNGKVILALEVLHDSHVAWQEQWKCFALKWKFVPIEKRIYCSCHATCLPCKTSIDVDTMPLQCFTNRAMKAATQLGADQFFTFELRVVEGIALTYLDNLSKVFLIDTWKIQVTSTRFKPMIAAMVVGAMLHQLSYEGHMVGNRSICWAHVFPWKDSMWEGGEIRLRA